MTSILGSSVSTSLLRTCEWLSLALQKDFFSTLNNVCACSSFKLAEGVHLLFPSVVYLTFVKAVILILKHATFLLLKNLQSGLAITHAELDYQKANTDLKIQQYLMASSQEPSVEQLASFIMDTDIECTHPNLDSYPSHPPNPLVPSQSSVDSGTHVYRKDHWFQRFLEPLRKTTRRDKAQLASEMHISFCRSRELTNTCACVQVAKFDTFRVERRNLTDLKIQRIGGVLALTGSVERSTRDIDDEGNEDDEQNPKKLKE
ncbi:hypothetical protein EI94DRAFT_1697176 [Lactarius quietus]|nr:hypothetical protein EI94DRAFT_1697176 [Lactarius quietus]